MHHSYAEVEKNADMLQGFRCGNSFGGDRHSVGGHIKRLVSAFPDPFQLIGKDGAFVKILQPVGDRRISAEPFDHVFDVVSFHAGILKYAVDSGCFPGGRQQFAHIRSFERMIHPEFLGGIDQFIAGCVPADQFIQTGIFAAAGRRESVSIEYVGIFVEFQSMFKIFLRRLQNVLCQFPVFLNGSHDKAFPNCSQREIYSAGPENQVRRRHCSSKPMENVPVASFGEQPPQIAGWPDRGGKSVVSIFVFRGGKGDGLKIFTSIKSGRDQFDQGRAAALRLRIFSDRIFPAAAAKLRPSVTDALSRRGTNSSPPRNTQAEMMSG